MAKPEYIREVEPEYYIYNNSKKIIKKGLFRCECGTEFVTRITKVKSGDVISCGCKKNKGWGH